MGVSGGTRLAPDGPRYKALGNSMAVPVMRWIGERIDLVQGILESRKAVEIVAGLNCNATHQEDRYGL